MTKQTQKPDALGERPTLEGKTSLWRYRAFCAWAIIGILLVAAAAFWGLSLVTSALMPLAVAFLLWFILKGIVSWCETKGIPRIWGTIIAFVVFALVWVVLSLLVFPVLGTQISELIKDFPSYIDQATHAFNSLGERYKQLEPSSSTKQLIDNATRQIVTWASSVAATSGTKIVAGASSAMNLIVSTFMSFILAFWLLKDGPRMGKEVRMLVSDRWRGDFDFFIDTAGKSVGGYLRGTLISSACTGAMATIGFSIIGVPYALILGLITAFLNIIPMIGPWIGGAIAAVVALFVSPLAAGLSIVVTIAAQQLTDTFVSPRVMSKNVEIHPVMVIVALLVGGALFGVIGTIISVPVLAIIKSIFVYYFERKTGKKLATAEGALFPMADQDKNARKKSTSQQNPDGDADTEKLQQEEPTPDTKPTKKGNDRE